METPEKEREREEGKRESVNKLFLLSFVFVLGIGAIQYGYSIGVYNCMQKDFQYIFKWKDQDTVNLWNGLITFCALGSAIGSIFAGSPAAKFGKLKCIHGTNIILSIGCSITLIQNEHAILFGRFLFGVAAGTFSVFVPSYINELSPNEMKGTLGSLTQILITLGIFISNIFGLPLPEDSNNLPSNFINNNYWRVIFGIPIILALI